MLKRWVLVVTVIGFSLTGFEAVAAAKKTGKVAGMSAVKTAQTATPKSSQMKGKGEGFYKKAYTSKQKKK